VVDASGHGAPHGVGQGGKHTVGAGVRGPLPGHTDGRDAEDSCHDAQEQSVRPWSEVAAIPKGISVKAGGGEVPCHGATDEEAAGVQNAE
jgi:hypothetical protein